MRKWEIIIETFILFEKKTFFTLESEKFLTYCEKKLYFQLLPHDIMWKGGDQASIYLPTYL